MAKPQEQPHTHTVGVAEFKARCLELLDNVGTRGDELIVTKRGTPIAKVVPIRSDARPLIGRWAGRGKIIGDIVSVNWADDWEAAK